MHSTYKKRLHQIDKNILNRINAMNCIEQKKLKQIKNCND